MKLVNHICSFGKWEYKRMCFFVLLSSLFLLFFSTTTSPIYIDEGLDSSVFKQMGLLILQGRVPYIDLFDHKGCIIYFINALGQWVGGRTGIFILQILNLSITVYFWDKIASFLLGEKGRLFVILYGLFALWEGSQFGNMTEEWSLPFISYPIYVYCKSLYSENKTVKLSDYLWIGVCVGVISFIRLNNIAPIVGFLGYMLGDLLFKRKIQELVIDLFYLFIGALLPIIPCIFYFYVMAGTKGVESLWLGTFLFNMKYFARNVDPAFSVVLRFYIPVLLMAGVSLLCAIKKKEIFLPLALSYIVTLLTQGKSLYFHYLITFVPLLVLSFALIFHSKNRWYMTLAVIAFVYSSSSAIGRCIIHLSDESSLYEKQSLFGKVFSKIPVEDRDSIWNYNGSPSYYQYVGIVPCNRIILHFQLQISPTLFKEEYMKLQKVSPKWILYFGQDISEIENKIDSEFIEQNYILYASETFEEESKVFLYKRIVKN